MIDIHTHLHPPRLFAAIRRWFADHSTWRLEHPTEPKAVAEALRAHGVDRFVFCSYAHKPGIASELNAWLAQTSRDLARYGVPLATVHLDDANYVRDMDSALNDGCVGLKLHEDVQRLRIDDERWEPIYERLAQGRFLLAHVGSIPWKTDPEGPLRIERVLRRHPNLPVVVAHMGADNTRSYFALMDRYANLHLDTTMSFSDASPMRVHVDRDAVERYADRILYGTDYPNVPYPYDSERTALLALELSDRARNAIFGDNARRLLARR